MYYKIDKALHMQFQTVWVNSTWPREQFAQNFLELLDLYWMKQLTIMDSSRCWLYRDVDPSYYKSHWKVNSLEKIEYILLVWLMIPKSFPGQIIFHP